MDGFSENFLEGLVSGLETIDSILGAIQVWIQIQEFFK